MNLCGPRNWLEFFHVAIIRKWGGGEYILIECAKPSEVYGRLFYYYPGSADFDKIIGIYDSLYSLFLGLRECFRRRVYFYEGDSEKLKINYKESDIIMTAYNQHSPYWNLFSQLE